MKYERATKVTALLPNLDGRGYAESIWDVGHKRLNPDGKKDEVTEIYVNLENRTAEIHYEDFGIEWVVNHISFIEYRKNARDREVQDDKG